MVVTILQVIHRHTDLQNALIQLPDVTLFLFPQSFECFVLLEVFTVVELFRPVDEECRRWLVTPRAHRVPIIPTRYNHEPSTRDE